MAGDDPLHAWALPLRRAIVWTDTVTLWVAPPEYVILRKLEFFREGGSSKHVTDVRAILASTAVDAAAIETWTDRLGLTQLWEQVREAGG